MLPLIRAAVAGKGKSAVKNAAVDSVKERASSMVQEKRTQNAERVKGLYNNFKNSNSSAHAAAMAKNNESNFEQKALTLLSSINGNTEALINRLSNEKKKGGLLAALLGGLGLLLTPFMGTLGKGLAILASPFKLLAKGIGFIGKKLLALFKFLKIGNLAKGAVATAGKVAGGAAKIAGAGAASIAGGAGALLGKVTSSTGLKALGKGAAKMGSKLIPGVGLAVGAGFAAKRASQGDYVGAIGEAASGIASTVPGIGTAAALAIQAGLIARDMSRNANKESEKTIKSTRKGVEAVNRNAVSVSQQQRGSFNSFTSNLSEMTTKTKDKLLEGTDKMLTSIKDFMPKMFTNIGGGITSMLKTLGDFGPKILDTIKASVAAIVAFASSPLTAVINKIKSMLPAWMGGDEGGGDVPRSTTAPTAKARENFGKVRDNIKNAAGKFGVDAGLLAKIAYFESGKSFSTNAAPISSDNSKNRVYNAGAGRNAISSAHGLGQFTDATWYGTLRKHGGAMGIGSNLSKAQMNGYRRNPQVQAMALAALTRDNMQASANISGGDVGADVYAMHNLGSGKGPQFLQQLRNNPNAPVSSVLSAVEIRNNPSLYGNGSISMKQAYLKMRGHIADGEEFATAINTDSAPVPVPVPPKSTIEKVTDTAKAAGGVLQAVSPISLLKTVNKKLSQKTPVKQTNPGGNGVRKTSNQSSNNGIKLKMPGTPFAPTSSNTSDEFDFSNLGDPNYKPKKMGFTDSLKYALNPSASGLTSNVAAKTNSKNPINPKTGKRFTNAELAAINNKINKIPSGPRSAGTVLIPGIGNVVKNAPRAIGAIPSVVRSIPTAASGVYNVITGNSKSNTKPATKVADMGGTGVLAKRNDTNMNGAGVLAKQKEKASSTSTPVYSTAGQYDTDMGMGGYTLPNAGAGMGDRIAATAERMVGGQTNSTFGRCARAVWFILGGAGIPGFPVTNSKSNNAKDWGASGIARARDAVGPLVQRGFREIATQGQAQNGDVDVLGPRAGAGAGHAGHIQVFANGKWYSDHVQGRRYTTDKYAWAKTFRYGADAATGEMAGNNSEPTMPGEAPELSMSEKIANMMSSVFTSENLDGLKEFIKGGDDDPVKPVAIRKSPIGEYTGKQEYVLRDFGFGENKNGIRSENLKRVLGGSKDRQLGDVTGIRETTGFKGSKDRQFPDSTGIAGTPGFQGSDDRQWGDTSGIAGTPGFNGSKDRQGKSKKGKWWESLFSGSLGNILEGAIPGFGALFGLIKSKDYAGILGSVLGMVYPTAPTGAGGLEGVVNGGFGGGIYSDTVPTDNGDTTNYEGDTTYNETATESDVDGITVSIDDDMPERTSENGTFGIIPYETSNETVGYGRDPYFGNGDVEGITNGGFGGVYSENGSFGSIGDLDGISNGGFGGGSTGGFGDIQLEDLGGISNGGFGGGSASGILGAITSMGGFTGITKAIKDKDYGALINGVTGNSQLEGIYSNIKSKSFNGMSNDLFPSDSFMSEGLSKIKDINFDNKLKMQSRQTDAAIITQPAQSQTVNAGSSDGAVIPISVRNNDSIIREIAKEYLKSSL